MAFSLITNSAAVGTTSGVDTTGANFIIVYLAYDGAGTVSDSKSNSWTYLTAGGAPNGRFGYVVNPTVGTGHTFTVAPSYGAVFMEAFSGSATSPFDVQNGNYATGSVSSNQTGSVTPSQSNEVVITGLTLGFTQTNISVDSGFTKTNSINAITGTSYGGGIGYKIQTDAVAVNPTWSWTTAGTNSVTRIATFKIPSSGFFAIL